MWFDHIDVAVFVTSTSCSKVDWRKSVNAVWCEGMRCASICMLSALLGRVYEAQDSR